MPGLIRTDVSEDVKGDPSRIIPQQPDPTHRAAEPMLPRPDQSTPPPAPSREKQTPADRRQLDADPATRR